MDVLNVTYAIEEVLISSESDEQMRWKNNALAWEMKSPVKYRRGG